MIAPAERKPDLTKYEIKDEIGHGGMAVVYLARDRRLGRDVAVKLIHRHLRENKEVAARFASEARAVAKLKHPNIVEVYDVSDEEEEERYLIVELVRGTTLRKLLSEHRQLPAEIAACIGVEVANALDHAHGMGVIHRDVKPENVLVATPNPGSSDGQRTSNPSETLVKITDFGIAKLLDAQGVTSTGQVLGSPAHMAPEQIEGGDVNARSDVFGLGVLLYEAMVGRLPFDGKNPAQVLRRVLDGAFTSADKARPTIGSRFAAIVGKALAHDAANRYASAAELSQALRDELSALGYLDVRGELSAFLVSPEAFREGYEARVVAALVRRAADARKVRDIPLSAACLNRALAFRPDDADLLAEVTSLGRAQRVRRNLVSAAIALGGSALIAGLGFAAVHFGQSLAKGGKSTLPGGVPVPRPNASGATPRLADSAAELGAERVGELFRPGARRKAKTPPRVPAGPEPDRALVSIVVDGPQNALVTLDGVSLEDWFGLPREITVGPHTFEFQPKSPDCCEAGQKLTVEIRPRPDGKPQIVQGRIAWKSAILELSGSPGSSASCGELGTFPVPSRQSLAMSGAQRRARCTLLPPPGSTVPPKEFDVTLSPGRVFRFPGP